MTSLHKAWKQRDAEAFFRARKALETEVPSSVVEMNGNSVRAAATAGLIDDLTPEAVGDLRPAEVVRLAQEIDDVLREAFALEGE